MIIHSVQPEVKTKEERIREFVRSLQAIEQAIEPYVEQRKDLRKDYIANGWLSKTEMKHVMKAYALMKNETDFDELEQMYKKVTGG